MNFVYFNFIGPQAIIWTSQIQGVLAIDPHPAKPVEIRSDIP